MKYFLLPFFKGLGYTLMYMLCTLVTIPTYMAQLLWEFKVPSFRKIYENYLGLFIDLDGHTRRYEYAIYIAFSIYFYIAIIICFWLLCKH